MAKLDGPDRLERERRRFSQSPVSSCRSGSTQFDDAYVPSPHPIGDQKIKLERAYRASMPGIQFDNQVRAEISRIMEKDPDAHLYMVQKPAKQAVKNAWLEQGIWRPNWDENTGEGIGVRWKHQDPLENEGEIWDRHWNSAVVTNPVPRNFQNEEERRSMERDRDASRPLPQFLYQVGKACDRLVREYQATTPTAPTPPDLGTVAYNEVKELWRKWGIWSNRWGILPGRTWKHEQPFEDMLRDELPEALPLLEEDVKREAARIANQAANQRPLQRLIEFRKTPLHITSQVPPYTGRKSLEPPYPSLFGGYPENPEPPTQPQLSQRPSQQASPSQPKDASHKTRGGRVIKDARPREARSRKPARPSTEVAGVGPVSKQSKRSPGRPGLNVSGDRSIQAQRGSRRSETYEKERSSRRQAGMKPEYEMLGREARPSSRQPSNAHQTSSSGPRSGKQSKKPTAARGVKPQGILKSRQTGTGRPKRTAKAPKG